MKHSRDSLHLILAACGCLLFAGLAGCESLFKSRLLERHSDNNPRAAAEDRWNTVRARVKLRQAEQHFEAGRLDQAEATLLEVCSLSPKEIAAYKLATRLFLERGQLAKAREMITAAEALPNFDAEAEYLAGMVEDRYGNLTGALTRYHAAQTLDEDVPEYLLAAAEVQMALKRPAEALALVEPRLKDFEGFAPLQMLAARINQRLGRKRAALEHARIARLLQTDDPRIDIEVGLLAIWAGQHAEAVGLLRPLVDRAFDHAPIGTSRDPKGNIDIVGPSIVRALAEAYIALKDFKEARVVLRPLMARAPEDVTTWCLFIRAALMSGDLDAAAEAVATFNRRNTPTAETLLLEAYISCEKGAYVAARSAARAALRIDANLESAFWLLGRAAQESGRLDEARKAYVKALALDPGSEVLHARIGQVTPQRESTAVAAANRPATLAEAAAACPVCHRSPCVLRSERSRSDAKRPASAALQTAQSQEEVEP